MKNYVLIGLVLLLIYLLMKNNNSVEDKKCNCQ